jgi:hypothetical protein
VAIDSSSNSVYITGQTISSSLDAVANAGGAQTADAFLTKYNGDSSSGSKLWTVLLGSDGDETANAVAVDPISGNIYIAGSTSSGSLDGNTNAGDKDAFLAKYDSSGTKLWTRLFGSSGNDDIAYSVAVDATAGGSNVYIAGKISVAPFGGGDAFLVKYDGSGNQQWSRLLDLTSSDVANGVAVDATSGSVYIAGEAYNGTADDSNAFLAKYDSSGTKQWHRLLGSTSTDYANGVATDGSGNVYMAGSTQGALDGHANAGAIDAFLAKYDGSGTKQWTRLLGNSSYDTADCVAADTNGNVYMAGATASSFLDGNNNAGGNTDTYIAAFNSSGNKQWTRLFGGTGDDSPNAVATDGTGNVFLAGYTTSSSLNSVANAGGHSDAFLIELTVSLPPTTTTASTTTTKTTTVTTTTTTTTVLGQYPFKLQLANTTSIKMTVAKATAAIERACPGFKALRVAVANTADGNRRRRRRRLLTDSVTVTGDLVPDSPSTTAPGSAQAALNQVATNGSLTESFQLEDPTLSGVTLTQASSEPTDQSSSDSFKMWYIAPIVGGTLLLLVAIVAAIITYKRKKSSVGPNSDMPMQTLRK